MKQTSWGPHATCCKGGQSIPCSCKLVISARHFVCIFFLNVDIKYCASLFPYSVHVRNSCAVKNCFQNVQFTVCMHMYGKTCLCIPPPPIFPTKILVIAYSCDDLLRKLQRGVCIFSFSFFYHLCGSYYVHSNIVNIKGSIQACFLNFHVSNTSLPSLFYQTYSWIHLVFEFQLITIHHGYQKTRVRVCVLCFLSCLLSFHLSCVEL